MGVKRLPIGDLLHSIGGLSARRCKPKYAAYQEDSLNKIGRRNLQIAAYSRFCRLSWTFSFVVPHYEIGFAPNGSDELILQFHLYRPSRRAEMPLLGISVLPALRSVSDDRQRFADLMTRLYEPAAI